MSLTYTQDILRRAISKICQDIGWDRGHLSCVNVLSDILAYYIQKLSIAIGDQANLAGRTTPTLGDVQAAFDFMKIDHNQLVDFITNVESSPLEIPLPFYPIPNRQDRIFDQVDENEVRPEWYYHWFPSLNLNQALELDARLGNANKNLKVSPDIEELKQSDHNESIDTSSEIDKSASKEIDAIEPVNGESKSKLVLKLSFPKPLEDSEVNQDAVGNKNENSQSTKAKQLNMFQELKSCKAFQEFCQSALVENPLLVKHEFIVANHNRLPISNLAPDMCQDLESPSNSNMAQNISESLKENDLKFTKKIKKNRNSLFDFDEDERDLNERTPVFKVKEPGQAKEKKKNEIDKDRKREFIKPISIKVTGFGLSGNDEKEPPFGKESSPKASETETIAKKRYYKRKEKPPKEKPFKKIRIQKTLEEKEKISQSATLKAPQKASFSMNDAAKTLVWMSNDGIPQKSTDEDSMQPRAGPDDSMDSSAKDLDDHSTGATKSASKKVGRPSTKRNKGIYSKKIVKSAEVVESSGDSSSDGEMTGDANPISLLPPPPEPTLEDVLIKESGQAEAKKKRRDSDVSSNSSISNNSLSPSPAMAATLEDKLKKDKKHKKKKRSKDKRHRSTEEKAERKKQKKEKKEKLKERQKTDKSDDKEEDKVYKPKLNIKLKYSDVNTPSPVMPGNTSDQTSKNFDLLGPSMSVIDEQFEGKNKIKVTKKRPAIPEEPPLVFIKDNKEKIKETKTKTPIIKIASEELLESNIIRSVKKKKDTAKKIKEKSPALLDVVFEKVKEEEKKKTKDKGKLEKEKEKKKKDKEDTKSCKLYRETIGEKSFTDTDKDWACPICNLGHLECTTIGCDNCDKWFHYTCLGITSDPSDNETWYCPKCAKLARKSEKKQSKVKSAKKEKQAKIENNDITSYMSAVLLQQSIPTPKTPGYTPTGRPRGRPRKDSNQGQHSGTTPMSPPSFELLSSNFEDISSAPNLFPQHSWEKSQIPAPKRRKEICLVCCEEFLNCPMLCCNDCKQWFHWTCVNIECAPSPDTTWSCNQCKIKKSKLLHREGVKGDPVHISLTDSKFLVATGSGTSKSSHKVAKRAKQLIEIDEDADVQDSERCGVCFKASDDDSELKWIACDDCSKWYHFSCVELNESPPEDEPWFCKFCVEKQINIVEKFKKMRRL